MRSTIVLTLCAALGLAIVASAALYVPSALAAEAAPDAVSGGELAPSAAQSVAAPAPGAVAADPAPTPDDPEAFFTHLFAAAKAGKWLVLGGMLLIGLVWVARRKTGWLVSKFTWLATDRGGAFLVLALGVIGEVAATLVTHGDTGAPPGLLSILLAAVAAGLRIITKSLVVPRDKPRAG